MDSISQIVLGAAMGEVALGKKIGNKAMAWGALAGTIPDLDVLFSPFVNDVQALTIHRGFSHSLVFAFIAAPILAWLLTKWYKNDPNKTTFRDWQLLFFLGIFTHPLLDTFTTYGTQLFLPFSDYRAGFNSVFVVDPLYTIPFLLCLLIALFFNRTSKIREKIVYVGITLSCIYLGIGLISKHFANEAFKKAFAAQNIKYERFMTSPTPLNGILWYGVAEVEEGYYTGYYSLLDKDYNIQLDYLARQDDLIADIKDAYAIDRIIWFSNGYYIVREDSSGLKMFTIKFGRESLVEAKDEAFVFPFDIIKEPNGEISFGQSSGPPDMDINDAFSQLWLRLKGDKTIGGRVEP